MGGPLSKPLLCQNDVIKTFYSENGLEFEDTNFKDLEYVEMYSNDKQSETEYTLYRFFTHKPTLDILESIIDLSDNFNHQCWVNSKACFETEDSFTK